jgi:short-subunit dehydrogenase
MNKLIVVTGGSKGIGKAIIWKFAAHGFDIATCARNKDSLNGLAAQLRQDFPSIQVHTFLADLSKKDQIVHFTDFVQNLNRNIDVLVNNAGFFVPGEVHNEPDGQLELMIETNLYSAYYTTRGLIENMKKNKHGHIFNICSVASITAYTAGGSYGIAKHALLGFSKNLREEMKLHQIAVTTVLPGATYTDSWAASGLPEERFMKAEYIAELIFTSNKVSGSSVVEEILIRPQLGDI